MLTDGLSLCAATILLTAAPHPMVRHQHHPPGWFTFPRPTEHLCLLPNKPNGCTNDTIPRASSLATPSSPSTDQHFPLNEYLLPTPLTSPPCLPLFEHELSLAAIAGGNSPDCPSAAVPPVSFVAPSETPRLRPAKLDIGSDEDTLAAVSSALLRP